MKRTLAVALAALATGVAGCGGDESKDDTGGGAAQQPTQAQTGTGSQEAQPGGGGPLKLSADPSGNLKFDKTSLTAKAGKVTIVMDNPSSVPHAVGIEGKGVDEDGKVVQKGGTSTVSADLKPGEYEFYCPVPGHEEAGMKVEVRVG